MKEQKIIKTMQWLDMGIFPGSTVFICGFDYDEIMSLFKKKRATQWWTGIENERSLIEKGNYFGLYRSIENIKTKKEVNLFYIIIREQFTFTDEEYCKLAHEVLHICQFFLPPILNRDREWESEAYLHTHLMRQCLKALRG